MHVMHMESTLETLSRYSKGEKISHDVMRVVASDILEMYTKKSDELKELEQDLHELFHKKNKEQIRERFLADPKHPFAVAFRLVQDAAEDNNPGERIQLIGEVAKEFGIEISDYSY